MQGQQKVLFSFWSTDRHTSAHSLALLCADGMGWIASRDRREGVVLGWLGALGCPFSAQRIGMDEE